MMVLHCIQYSAPPPTCPTPLSVSADSNSVTGGGRDTLVCLLPGLLQWTHQSVAPSAVPLQHPQLQSLWQVVICHNRLGSRQEIETALVHELVHAYDHCRAANLDWNNCEHHACSEVRTDLARSNGPQMYAKVAGAAP